MTDSKAPQDALSQHEAPQQVSLLPVTLEQAIASADLFELLAVAFAYPTERLLEGLSEGYVREDVLACFLELHAPDHLIEHLQELFDGVEASGDHLSFMSMKKEYTHLYMVLGEDTKLFPFEGTYLHVIEKQPVMPSMFQTQVTQDVEDWMRRCNALPATTDAEPVDSVYSEFNFMRKMFTNLAKALQLGDHDDAAAWWREIVGFRAEHIDKWIPLFMKHTLVVTNSAAYAGFARLALLALIHIPGGQTEK